MWQTRDNLINIANLLEVCNRRVPLDALYKCSCDKCLYKSLLCTYVKDCFINELPQDAEDCVAVPLGQLYCTWPPANESLRTVSPSKSKCPVTVSSAITSAMSYRRDFVSVNSWESSCPTTRLNGTHISSWITYAYSIDRLRRPDTSPHEILTYSALQFGLPRQAALYTELFKALTKFSWICLRFSAEELHWPE